MWPYGTSRYLVIPANDRFLSAHTERKGVKSLGLGIVFGSPKEQDLRSGGPFSELVSRVLRSGWWRWWCL